MKRIIVPRETFELLNIEITEEILEKFENFIDLLIKWNNKFNLTSRGENVESYWIRHILDCAQMINYIDININRVYDLGSGAGFPGIILSILNLKEINLIESNFKKSVFLELAAKISKNKVIIHNLRVEEIKAQAQIITSRAFASLDKIFTLTKNLRTTNTKLLLLKGITIESEIKEATKKWDFKYNLYQNKLSQGYIIEINNVFEKK